MPHFEFLAWFGFLGVVDGVGANRFHWFRAFSRNIRFIPNLEAYVGLVYFVHNFRTKKGVKNAKVNISDFKHYVPRCKDLVVLN